MGNGRAEGLAYLDGTKVFDTSISIPGAKLATDWMNGWIDYPVREKLAEPVIQH